jgi:hypothetical protein
MLVPLANGENERRAIATGGGGGAGAIAIIYAPAAMSQSEEGTAVAMAVVSNNSHEFHDTTVERCTGGSNHRFEAEAGSVPDQATAVGGGGGAAGICVIIAPAAAAAAMVAKVSTQAHTIVEQNQVDVHTALFNDCRGGANMSFISNKANAGGCSSGYAQSSSALGGGGGGGALAVIHGPAASTRTKSGDSFTVSGSNNNSQTIAASNFSLCTGGESIGFDSSGSNQSISAVGGGGGAGALALIHGPAASSNYDQSYVEHWLRDGGSTTTSSSDGNSQSIASSNFSQCVGGESISFGSSGHHVSRFDGEDGISALGGGGGAGALAVIHVPAASSRYSPAASKNNRGASSMSSSDSNSQTITTSRFSQCIGGKSITFDSSGDGTAIAIGGGGGAGALVVIHGPAKSSSNGVFHKQNYSACSSDSNSQTISTNDFNQCSGGKSISFYSSSRGSSRAVGGGGGAGALAVIHGPASTGSSATTCVSSSDNNWQSIMTSNFSHCVGGESISFDSSGSGSIYSGYGAVSVVGGGGGAGALAVIHGPAASASGLAVLSSSNNNSQSIATSNFSVCTGGGGISFESSGSAPAGGVLAVGGGGGAGALVVIHSPTASTFDHSDCQGMPASSSSSNNSQIIATSSFSVCTGGENVSFNSSPTAINCGGNIIAVGGGGGAGALAVIHSPTTSAQYVDDVGSCDGDAISTSNSDSNDQTIETIKFSRCTGGESIRFYSSSNQSTIVMGGGGGAGALAVIHGPASTGSSTTVSSSDSNSQAISTSNFSQCTGGKSISFDSSFKICSSNYWQSSASAVGGGGGAGALAVIHGPASSVASRSNNNSQIIATSSFSVCTGGENISFDSSSETPKSWNKERSDSQVGVSVLGGGGGAGALAVIHGPASAAYSGDPSIIVSFPDKCATDASGNMVLVQEDTFHLCAVRSSSIISSGTGSAGAGAVAVTFVPTGGPSRARANTIVLSRNGLQACSVVASCVCARGWECGEAGGIAVAFISKTFIPGGTVGGTVVVGNVVHSSNNSISDCTILPPATSSHSFGHNGRRSGGLLLLVPSTGLAVVHGQRWISDNDAFEGNQGLEVAGAVHVVNIEQALINGGRFRNNRVHCVTTYNSTLGSKPAECVGGGAIAYNFDETGVLGTSLSLLGTVVDGNRADLGGATAVYAAGGTAHFGSSTIVNMTGVSDSRGGVGASSIDGIPASAGGIVASEVELDSGSVIRCPPGQQVQRVGLPGLTQLQCSSCQCDASGQYVARCDNLYRKGGHANLVCSGCPLSAECGDGMRMRAKSGFWSATADAQPSFTHCQRGYCATNATYCPTDFTGCASINRSLVTERCASGTHRNSSSLLCSECEVGRTKALGSAACVLNSTCTAAKWMLPVGLLLLALAAWLLTTDSNDPSNALLRCFFYYFQTFGLVAPPSTNSDATAAVLGIFNMHVSGVAGGWAGSTCLWPGLGELPQAFLGVAVPVVLALFVLAVPHVERQCLLLFPLVRRRGSLSSEGVIETQQEQEHAIETQQEREREQKEGSGDDEEEIQGKEKDEGRLLEPLLLDEANSEHRLPVVDQGLQAPPLAADVSSNHRMWGFRKWKALTTLLLVTYSVVTETTMSLLRCIEVPGFGLRLVLAAEQVQCFEPWQLLLILILALLLAPFPLVLFMWVRAKQKQQQGANWKGEDCNDNMAATELAVLQVLEGPFKRTAVARNWELVVLGRRFVLLALYTFLYNSPFWQDVALAGCNVAILAAHLLVVPYRQPLEQGVETASLILLVFLSLLNFSAGVEGSTFGGSGFSNTGVVQLRLVLLLLPLGAMAVMVVLAAYWSHQEGHSPDRDRVRNKEAPSFIRRLLRQEEKGEHEEGKNQAYVERLRHELATTEEQLATERRQYAAEKEQLLVELARYEPV